MRIKKEARGSILMTRALLCINRRSGRWLQDLDSAAGASTTGSAAAFFAVAVFPVRV
jgi:hypothetical protein